MKTSFIPVWLHFINTKFSDSNYMFHFMNVLVIFDLGTSVHM